MPGLNRKYLRLEDLRRLEHLMFSTQRRVEGLFSGQHRTPQRGQSIEFQDYRQYMPGDEVARIDWKVYGRTDKLYLKRYEHQAQMTVHLLVDASSSMVYAGLDGQDPLSKYDQAALLAAAVGFLTVKQQDRISLALAQRGLYKSSDTQPTIPHLIEQLRVLENTLLREDARLAAAIDSLVERSGRRELLVIFSDLLEDRAPIARALAAWQHRGGEAILFHVLHPDERRLPAADPGVFIDSETGDELRISIEDIRADYEAQVREFLAGWERTCRAQAIDYNLVPTDEPYIQAIERYLIRRGGRK